MQKVWKKLPPLMADNFGFIEVINKTDGMGIIDDCSEYRTSAERHGRGGHDKGRGNYAESAGGGRELRRHGRHRQDSEGYREEADRHERGGRQDGGRRKEKGRRSSDPVMRVVHSEIDSEDVVTGTRQKVLDAFTECQGEYSPKFVLLSAGPCSAMIGTDLGEIAEQIEQDSSIPAAAVKLSGHKTYDVGISETLLSLVKLLAKPMDIRENTVNLIGENSLDWQEENASRIRQWAEEKNLQVIAELGGKEQAENIAHAAEASVNLVTTVSGLAAAKYLQREFGTPYISMAPFGKSWSERMLSAIAEKTQPESSVQQTEEAPEVLIVGEQLMGNAIRETLIRDYGMKNIQVCTFYTLAKDLAQPGDRRIRGEEDAEKLLRDGAFRLVIADPALRCMKPEGTDWIDLPHKAFELYGNHPSLPVLLGENLNQWLDQYLH